jgi:hypothetical protein
MSKEGIMLKRKQQLVITFLFCAAATGILNCNPDTDATETNHAKSAKGDNFTIDDMEINDVSPEILVDVEMGDGTLGWDPIIYEKQQAEQKARARAA